MSRRFWILTAAAIWIFIKLPQEYWIHVAQLDFTDSVREHPWLWAFLAVVLLAAPWWRHFLRRAPACTGLESARRRPRPAQIDTAGTETPWPPTAAASLASLEKVVLVCLVS